MQAFELFVSATSIHKKTLKAITVRLLLFIRLLLKIIQG